ncbi:ester cyclase [Streptomyces sp. NPDC002896]|uniref:nuclear transport factor 2 family protein n=1 Tax=Streptomyces sp. NPDC002896 TaxID=3154438 RepID=UPI0033208AE6
MSDLEANKRTVHEFYEQSFNQRDPRGAAERYLADVYIQHDPRIADGAEEFIKFVSELYEALPDFRAEFTLFIAEGPYVTVHSRWTGIDTTNPDAEAVDEFIGLWPEGSVGLAVIDTFRLDDNGKITEHWGIGEPIPATSVNDNGMI